MNFNFRFGKTLLFATMLLIAAPSAEAQRGGGRGSRSGHGGGGQSSSRGHSGFSRGYSGSHRSYAAPNRGFYNGGRSYYSAPRYRSAPRFYGGGFSSGRFYSGRGYYYGDRFWARPFFGIGLGIPFGYGYRTNRGCGYVDDWGDFYPAPCYSGY